MFKKYTCLNCGREYKKSKMAKGRDDTYTCISCQGLLSRYFPGCFKSSAEEIRQNISYMQKQREIYENIFLEDESKAEFRNDNLGIVISEKYGVFKVIDDEWADFNGQADCELFRLDQINRYEVFSENKKSVYGGEGAFIECGIRFYMNSEREEKYNKYKLQGNQKTHPYVYCLQVLTANSESLAPADTFEDYGLRVAGEVVSYLDGILGTTKEEMSESREKFGKLADEIFLEGI